MAKLTPVWSGVVDPEGRLRLDSRQLFEVHLLTLRNQPVTLTLKKTTRKKSLGQLGYLFGVVYPVFADALGYREYEVEEVHDAVMRKLRGLKPEPNPLQLRVSLKDMDHEQVSDYISDVRHFALMEYGCITPNADKVERAA